MKLNLLIASALVVTISSCSTAYRSGQTPDDLYYSPGRAQDEYVQANKDDDRSYEGDDPDDYQTYQENRYLRMRVANPSQWSVLDDYYFYSPLSYGYYGGAFSMGYGMNNPWSSYHMWNNYYNPYGGIYNNYYPGYYPGYYAGGGFSHNGYYGGYYGNGVANRTYRTPSRPLSFNPSSYSTGNSNRRSTSGRSSNGFTNGNSGSRYNNSNSRNYNTGSRPSGSGRNNNTYEPSRTSTPTRSYNPSNSTQSSGSSGRSTGGSSTTPPARPPR